MMGVSDDFLTVHVARTSNTIKLAHHIEEKVAYNHSKNRISSLHNSYSYVVK